jgi:hypothetical protein
MRSSRAPAAACLLAAFACGPHEGTDSSAAPARPGLEADLAAARLEVATLRQALAEERDERQALEAEVERLREQLDELAYAEPSPRGEAAARSGERGAGSAAGGEGASGAEAVGPGGGSDGGDRPWFDADALLRHGVSPAEVERLRDVFSESEFALLQLEDQARREGWFDQPRYRESLRDLRLALRAELGDDRFDRLLFATGRENRVIVADLLDDSPAQRSGLQAGDEILSYGDRRVFRAMELKHATTEGTAGERVEVEVLRDGARVRLWVPRGPLGIRLQQARRPPPW